MSKRKHMARIEREAADWFARNEMGVSEHERLALKAWLDSSPRHRIAYLRISAAWERAEELLPRVRKTWEAGLGPIVPAEGAPEPGSRCNDSVLSWLHWCIHGMGRYVATSVVVLLLGALPFLARPASGWFPGTYSTRPGIVRPVTLKDGSVAWLNTRSEIRWLFSWNDRRVELLSGEALFDVVHDEKHPFRVLLDSGEIRVVGTKFNVYRKDATKAIVTVLEGKVEVRAVRSSPHTPGQVWTLHPGDQLELATGSSMPEPHPVSLDHIAPWRGGFYAFENEPMENVVQELARYTDKRILIRGPCLSTAHFTGGLSINDIRKSLERLKKAAPLSVSVDEHSYVLTCIDR